jgi:hypothetical protein
MSAAVRKNPDTCQEKISRKNQPPEAAAGTFQNRQFTSDFLVILIICSAVIILKCLIIPFDKYHRRREIRPRNSLTFLNSLDMKGNFMTRTHLWIGLTLLLGSVPAAFGQESACAPCEPACEIQPCDPACDILPCDPCGTYFGNRLLNTPFTFGGWIESGIYTNSHSSGSNGPMHSASKERRDFQMSQLYLFAEKELDTKHGFDWGARADLVYGVDAGGMQSSESFDYEWGNNRHGYGMAAYQLYGTLGYKKLSVKYGKFITPVGWEESAAKNNFFYSHSYCYWIEPATHVGAVATYELTDRLTVNAGWTAGIDSGFKNRYDDSALLAGFTYSLTDKSTIYYWINQGRQKNGLDKQGSQRFDTIDRNDYFVQSFCYEWVPTDRFTYVLQYNLRNDNGKKDGSDAVRSSAYGINNHFLYTLTDEWSVGTRIEWLRDSGGGYYISDGSGDYYGLTFGLNWNPYENVSVRPEIRYDWVRGSNDDLPFADATRHEQVTGGCGFVVSF